MTRESDQLDLIRPPRVPGISVIAFSRVDGPNTLRGFADVHVVPWRFRILGCPAHAGHEDRRWIGLPGRPITNREGLPLRDETSGKIKYVAFCSFDDKDLLRRFSDAAASALDSYSPGWDR